MIEISKNANKNYLAKIIKIEKIRPHNGADKLQIVSIDFQTVITGLDAKNGDVYIYFPIECKINSEFLAYTNSFRDKELNQDKEKAGFFESNCRVKAMKLRGEKSMGYIVPASIVFEWANTVGWGDHTNKEFDIINGIKLVEKYQVKVPQTKKDKQGKKPKLSRLVEGQVHLHTDTENLRKNIHKLNPEDTISITYKTHGTSWWVSNVLAKKQLKWYEKLLSRIVNVVDTEYSIIYGSRKVVKNQHFDPKGQDHYFGYDLWADIKDQVADKIPKGYTLYGECLGYTKTGSFIQGGYDYGCALNTFKLEVYRITHTTPDGLVTELSYPEIKEFCDRVGLISSHLFYYGEARNWCLGYNEEPEASELSNIKDWREAFIDKAERLYNEKDCFMCKNKVIEEGVVIRKERFFSCESYKLKSFGFLEHESKQLDSYQINIEDNQ